MAEDNALEARVNLFRHPSNGRRSEQVDLGDDRGPSFTAGSQRTRAPNLHVEWGVVEPTAHDRPPAM